MRYLWFLLFPFLLFACQSDPASSGEEAAAMESDTAQWVVDRAIAAHGGDRIDHSRITFDFRDRHYVAERQGGQFTYERIWRDTSGDRVRDILTNEGLRREVNGDAVALSAKDSAAYANSTNSVIYFALQPYFLNDPAVRKTYLGQSAVTGEPYHKILITFRREGGGKDYEDEFVYWFHTETYAMDYLAYNYLTDGGGARFRQAYHVREVEGIRFADYINYKPVPDSRAVATFDQLLENGKMEELSRIDTENIAVELY